MERTSKASRGDGRTFPDLVEVMKRLLAPDGCPWDREQTLESLRPYLIEEAAEVLDAIDGGDPADHCEELGDLLMQVVFQAELRQAEGAFDIDDVVASIRDKLVRRHPHVFADATAEDAEEVLVQWEEIKKAEKAERGESPQSALDGVPALLPALLRAQAISKKAAKVGFDWPDVAGCRDKISEELEELDRAIAGGDQTEIAGELGDLLFAAVSLARKLGCDAEMALRDTTAKFVDRFEFIEDRLRSEDRSVEDADLDELDALWNRAKAAVSPAGAD
jgi:tetrapyrrole methylase family protein/MazG family protein/ATP diphosphatase